LPNRYKNGAFIAFHGSTNRAPYPQSGYFVGFVPFKDGKPSGDWEVFADGFAVVDTIASVNDAKYRPMGIAFGEDDSMYISDSVKGKIWKIVFEDDKDNFGQEQLAEMEKRKLLSHIRTPDEIKDNLMPKQFTGAQKTYYTYCSPCHQKDGKGATGRFPTLNGTDWVTGDKERLINIVLKGMEGSIVVNDEVFNGVMPQHGFLSDAEIADLITYLRSNFGNDADAVTEKEVSNLRMGL